MLASLSEFDPTPNFLKIMWGDGIPGSKFPGLSDHQLALYHRIPTIYAQKMRERRMLAPLASWPRFKYILDIGGVGSGKTFVACLATWMDSLSFPGNHWVTVRKHHLELRNTVIRTFEQVGDLLTDGHKDWLMSSERVRKEDGGIEFDIVTEDPKKPSLVVFRIEPDGSREKIEQAFRGGDQGGFHLEEVTELQSCTLDVQEDRTRLNGTALRGIMTCNPPDGSEHWVAKLRDENERALFDWLPWQTRPDDPLAPPKPRYLVLTSQTEDNKTLPREYIEDLKAKWRNDPIAYNMFILGKAGERVDGEGVFKNQFSYASHVRESVRFNPYRTLYCGWDFGFRTPACIFAQLDEEERLNVVAELIGSQQYIEAFCDDVTAFINRKFPVRKGTTEHWGDIAGEQVKDTGSSIARAQGRGFMIRTADCGKVMQGIDLMRKLLLEQRGGGMGQAPRIIIHPSCARLIKAMAGAYHFKKMNDGRFVLEPFKDEVNDHPVDALRYLVCNLFGLSDTMRSTQGRGQMKAKLGWKLGA